MVQAEDLKN